MNPESHINSLLLLWQEQQAMGRDLSAAELCRDCPELAEELKQRIQVLRHINSLLHPGGAASGGFTPVASIPAETGNYQADSASPDAGGTASTAGEHRSIPVPVPALVPGYEILEELGRGGMGVVYKARQKTLQRLVALKMIRGGASAGPEDLQRFRTEAEAVARLQHPNIVQIFEVDEHEGRPFFSLEFCPGGSLDRKLAGSPLPPEEAARLVETLAGAMQAAHQVNVIHRDLKPANVLLAADGTPKIADFGLAKKMDEACQTQTGMVMGTPSYMAPEQAEGKKAVGPAADVYALGAILYECLTGRPPFKAATLYDTMMQVMRQEPVPPRQLNAKVPLDLETICLKCLEKDPGRRYGSAQDLAEDLQRFWARKPIQARPAGALERAWRWCRRNPGVAVLVVAVAVTLLLGAAVATTLALIASRNADRADQARRQAEEALAEGRRRLTLNYIAYSRACALAARLATASDRNETDDTQEEFKRLFEWLELAMDEAVKPALCRYERGLHAWREGAPPKELRRLALQLAHACRDSWLRSVGQESPQIEQRIRKLLYDRACRRAAELAGARDWAQAKQIRREFWELYWGEMAIIESKDVEKVMVAIGRILEVWHAGPAPVELEHLALNLRSACQLPELP